MFMKAIEVSCCWLWTVNYPLDAQYIDYKWSKLSGEEHVQR